MDVREKIKSALSPLSEDYIENDGRAYKRLLFRLVEIFNSRGRNWIEIMGYDECAHIASEFIRIGECPPAPIDEFTIGVLSGKVVRSSRGPRKTENQFRDAVIVSAIWKALDCGLNPYRNDEASENNSACDVVSECLQEFGVHMTYKSIAKIWSNRPRPQLT